MPNERTKLVGLLVSAAFTSPAAQRAAARNPELRVELCRNRHLDESVWLDLYTHKPKLPVEQACNLARQELSRAQAEHLLAKEHRTKVLEVLVIYSTLDPDLQEKVLAAKGFTPSLASRWLHLKKVHPDLQRRVAVHAGGATLIKWLSGRSIEELPTEKFLEIFAEWNGFPSGTYTPGPLEELVGLRSDATETFINHPNWTVRKAAASSRHLLTLEQQCRVAELEVDQAPIPLWEYGSERMQVLYSLMENPNLHPELARTIVKMREKMGFWMGAQDEERFKAGYTPITEPWESISDPEQLERICTYVFGGQYFHRRHRAPSNAHALAHNPNLPESWKTDLCSELLYVDWKPGSSAARAVEAYRRIHGEDSLIEPVPRKRGPELYPESKRREFDPNVPALQLKGGGGPAVTWMTEALNEDEAAWDVLLTLLDGFEGSVAELADMVLHI